MSTSSIAASTSTSVGGSSSTGSTPVIGSSAVYYPLSPPNLPVSPTTCLDISLFKRESPASSSGRRSIGAAQLEGIGELTVVRRFRLVVEVIKNWRQVDDSIISALYEGAPCGRLLLSADTGLVPSSPSKSLAGHVA